MEEIPKNFKSSEEIILGSPENKRPENFLFNGEIVNEHSIEQREVINISKKIIDNHLDKIGVEQKYPFDINRISYKIPGDIGTSYFGPNTDIVSLNKIAEANLGTTIHELLHAYSSQFRNYDADHVHKNAIENKKSISSGFHTNHHKDGYDNKFTSINFSAFNEAVTEKLARELFSKNYDKVEKIKPLFKGKAEKIIERVNLRHEKNKEEVEDKIEEIKNKFDQKRKTHLESIPKEIEATRQEMINNNEYDEEMFSKFEENMQNSKESFIEMLDSFEESEINMAKFGSDEYQHKSFVNDIKNNYSFNPEREAYQNNIELLELMLEGVALSKANSFDEIENIKSDVWENLQRAYFNGKPMFLRNFDKAYADNVMRKFEKFNYKTNDDPDLFEELKKEFISKNIELSRSLL